VIALQAAVVCLGGRPVLHDIDLVVAPGQLAALCGPNGAGKSTLLRALAGLLPGTPPRDPRRVAYLPQGASCAWGLTVAEVAALGRIPHRDAAGEPVTRALQACGVIGLRDARVDRISGGQARRAMLARAFATEPEVFLLDEPTADLDPAAAHEVMTLLRDTAHGAAGDAAAGAPGDTEVGAPRRSVLVVMHALDLAMQYADRIVVLRQGRIVADAAPAEALPHAAAAFGLPFGSDPAPRLLPPR
jgi:iron complex transport system ATP-binding protein